MTQVPPMPPLDPEPAPPAGAERGPRGTWVGLLIALGVGAILDASLHGPPGLGWFMLALATAVGVIVVARPRGTAFAGDCH
jgi:hypothetical protein